MHPNYLKAQALSVEIIGAAIEVHRHKGPGLIESIYEKCLMRELQLRGSNAVSQLVVPIDYKGFNLRNPFVWMFTPKAVSSSKTKSWKRLCPSTEPNSSAICDS